jgi:hypothetical protein
VILQAKNTQYYELHGQKSDFSSEKAKATRTKSLQVAMGGYC